MPPEILILEPRLVKKIWGITQSEQFTHIKAPAYTSIGEVYLASAQTTLPEKGQEGTIGNRVMNVADGTRTFHDIFGTNPQQFLGRSFSSFGTLRGKTEAWYIRAVRGEVRAITGLQKQVTKEMFAKIIASGVLEDKNTMESLVPRIFTTSKLEPGQVYINKARGLHTLWPVTPNAFVVIDEIQQGFGTNLLPTLSKILLVHDILSLQVHPDDLLVQQEQDPFMKQQYLAEPTLRIADFGRGRSCHTTKALEVLLFGKITCSLTKPLRRKIISGVERVHLVANRYFAKDLLTITKQAMIRLSTEQRYIIYHVLTGKVSFHYNQKHCNLEAGQTVFVPPHIHSYAINAHEDTTLLGDYVPDLLQLKETLQQERFALEDIRQLDGTCYQNDFDNLNYSKGH